MDARCTMDGHRPRFGGPVRARAADPRATFCRVCRRGQGPVCSAAGGGGLAQQRLLRGESGTGAKPISSTESPALYVNNTGFTTDDITMDVYILLHAREGASKQGSTPRGPARTSIIVVHGNDHRDTITGVAHSAVNLRTNFLGRNKRARGGPRGHFSPRGHSRAGFARAQAAAVPQGYLPLPTAAAAPHPSAAQNHPPIAWRTLKKSLGIL